MQLEETKPIGLLLVLQVQYYYYYYYSCVWKNTYNVIAKHHWLQKKSKVNETQVCMLLFGLFWNNIKKKNCMLKVLGLRYGVFSSCDESVVNRDALHRDALLPHETKVQKSCTFLDTLLCQCPRVKRSGVANFWSYSLFVSATIFLSPVTCNFNSLKCS